MGRLALGHRRRFGRRCADGHCDAGKEAGELRHRRLEHTRWKRLARGDDLLRQGAGARERQGQLRQGREPERRSLAEQNADLRNLISAGANAIVVNPSSPNALNAVIAQAASRGVKVVSVDQRVTAPQAHNATNDQVAYGRLGATWLFKQLGGKGNVVEMRGIAGVPADTDRHTGFRQALKKYPGIKVVKQTFTGWQFATGGKQILDILNSGVKVDGVWTSGIDYTIVNAFRTAQQEAGSGRGRRQQPVPEAADDRQGVPRGRRDEPGHDRRRRRRDRDQAARWSVGAELGQADAAGVGQQDGGRHEADQGELFTEPSPDVQRAVAGEAVDDLQHRSSSSAARGRRQQKRAGGASLRRPSRLSRGEA